MPTISSLIIPNYELLHQDGACKLLSGFVSQAIFTIIFKDRKNKESHVFVNASIVLELTLLTFEFREACNNKQKTRN